MLFYLLIVLNHWICSIYLIFIGWYNYWSTLSCLFPDDRYDIICKSGTEEGKRYIELQDAKEVHSRINSEHSKNMLNGDDTAMVSNGNALETMQVVPSATGNSSLRFVFQCICLKIVSALSSPCHVKYNILFFILYLFTSPFYNAFMYLYWKSHYSCMIGTGFQLLF